MNDLVRALTDQFSNIDPENSIDLSAVGMALSEIPAEMPGLTDNFTSFREEILSSLLFTGDEEGFVLRHEGDATGFELYANMAGMYADIGNYSIAMEYYDAALSMQPRAALVVNNLGYMHELMGNLDLAAQHYRRALELLLPERHYQIEVNLANLEKRMADDKIKTEQSRMRAAERGAVDRVSSVGGGKREGDEASVTGARGVGRNGPGGLLVKERPAE